VTVLVAFVSAKGSPGVTTSALAIGAAWPRRAVVVDADPAGGDVAAGLGRGSWPAAAGLMELVIDMRTMPIDAALRQRALQPAAHCPLALAGFGQPGQAAGVPWHEIADGFSRVTDADVLVDCGRFAAGDSIASLLRRSDLLVLVTRSTLPAVRAAARLAPLLRELILAAAGDPRLSVLVVAPDRPYSGGEIAQSCEVPLLGELPFDPRTAVVWSEGAAPGRGLRRTPLQREGRHIAELLANAPVNRATTAGDRR
jgi:MinD-like ATPase involved in chromosome partitioning or flagellar assembly